jgi:NAD+ synthase (glutamine-hydrolysing)
MPRIALAQINPTVGDIKGNTAAVIAYIKKARARQADIVVFPELVLTGYPPEDLLNMPEFIAANLKALDEIRRASGRITVVVGFVDTDGNRGRIYNSAAILSNKKKIGVYHKMHLPNYGVFDEKRYFTTGQAYPVFQTAKTKIGVNICEDIWVDSGPADHQAKKGRAKVIINISSSPFYSGKHLDRCQILSRRARENGVYLVYVNLIGGQDELVFDGRSLVFNPDGDLIAQAKSFSEDLLVVDIPQEAEDAGCAIEDGGHVEEIYEALKLGLKDYIRKNGFKKVLIGVSGGIDSALTALIAVDALGRKNVLGFYLPSRFSSPLSRQCSLQLARNLGLRLLIIPIDGIYRNYLSALKISGRRITLAHENLQSRIRGTLMMAVSNRTGAMVLTTGNKSELSTGYATLYGDMAGGFALLKDVSKTLVYELAAYGNELFYNQTGKYAIPHEIISRPPTAELKPNQQDSDSLPAYDTLDPILQAYIEDNKGRNEIARLTGAPLKTIDQVIKMAGRSEYKRRQSPPGVKITPRAFGKDRRFPITAAYNY